MPELQRVLWGILGKKKSPESVAQQGILGHFGNVWKRNLVEGAGFEPA
jgi:hypothetical protein